MYIFFFYLFFGPGQPEWVDSVEADPIESTQKQIEGEKEKDETDQNGWKTQKIKKFQTELDQNRKDKKKKKTNECSSSSLKM